MVRMHWVACWSHAKSLCVVVCVYVCVCVCVIMSLFEGVRACATVHTLSHMHIAGVD